MVGWLTNMFGMGCDHRRVIFCAYSAMDLSCVFVIDSNDWLTWRVQIIVDHDKCLLLSIVATKY